MQVLGLGLGAAVCSSAFCPLPQVSLALHRPSGCLSNSLVLIESSAPLFHKQIRKLRRTGRLLWGLVLVVPGKAVCSWSWCWW